MQPEQQQLCAGLVLGLEERDSEEGTDVMSPAVLEEGGEWGGVPASGGLGERGGWTDSLAGLEEREDPPEEELPPPLPSAGLA